MERRDFLKTAVMAVGALSLSGIAEGASSDNSVKGKTMKSEKSDKKVLVAYFSASRVTAGVASRLAAAIGADLREIIPETPYTDADLNWHDKQSRSSLEMSDRASRPAIHKSSLGDISAYDVAFVGFPIWWYREPSIIDTFMEALDFSGKTVIPFATSGSSGMGDSAKNIQALAPKAKVLDGKRFPADVSEKDLAKWAAPIVAAAPKAASSSSSAPVGAATVYFTKHITPDALVKIYQKLGRDFSGKKVAVKLSTGEAGNNHYLHPELIGKLVQSLKADIVECNTAYAGSRMETKDHKKTIADHGFPKIAKVVILDEFKDIEIPTPKGSKHLKSDRIGAAFKDYDAYIILNHFKGHQMGGFGGALKNLSIGVGSTAGKARIHSAGRTDDANNLWHRIDEVPQKDFIESMAEAAGAVVNDMGDRAVYINVMNNISIDCDCNGNPAKPEMDDIGILASLDPIALDKACVDLVYASDPKKSASLRKRMEKQLGTVILTHGEALGYGTQKYSLVSLDPGERVPSTKRVD